MNKFELRLRYKEETSQRANPITAWARVGKFGDVILDGSLLDEEFVDFVGRDGTARDIEFPDPDYHRWLEEKLMELL